MKKLLLSDFFIELQKEIYCIVKLDPNFPNYTSGSDIDIFCYNIESMSKNLLLTGNSYLNEGYEIKVTNLENKDQVHIDFMIGDKIEFRFDLYKRLPIYHKILIKPALFESIIEKSVIKKISTDSDNYVVYIPSPTDEKLIRYIEYQEWYCERPDKIKHIEFILNNPPTDDEQINFLQKLHHYTEIPKTYVHHKKQGLSFTRKLKNIYIKIRSKTLLGLIKASILLPIKTAKKYIKNCFKGQ
jgi:hypothetical protein